GGGRCHRAPRPARDARAYSAGRAPRAAPRPARAGGRARCRAMRRQPMGSVLVPVVVVGGVTVPVVHVVDVVIVADGLVATALAVLVVVRRVRDMGVGRALVPVAVVLTMGMAVVEVVGVVVVTHGHVPAIGVVRVSVVVAGMSVVGGCHELVLSCAWMMASLTMWATCSSLSEEAISR